MSALGLWLLLIGSVREDDARALAPDRTAQQYIAGSCDWCRAKLDDPAEREYGRHFACDPLVTEYVERDEGSRTREAGEVARRAGGGGADGLPRGRIRLR